MLLDPPDPSPSDLVAEAADKLFAARASVAEAIAHLHDRDELLCDAGYLSDDDVVRRNEQILSALRLAERRLKR